MNHHDIEAWALRVVDAAMAGHAVEDDRVELKAELPPAAKAARRMAGHLNASRGGLALWLLGVDEAGRIAGASREDVAAWWAQVEPCFDELAPEPQFVNIPYEGRTVVALVLDGERRPFVVKNPAHGTAGNAVEREVPWRTATGVRSAKRADLIRLLNPLARLPELEVSEVIIDAHGDANATPDNNRHRWSISWNFLLYIVPREEVVLPEHRASAELRAEDGSLLLEWDELTLEAPQFGIRPTAGFAETVRKGSAQVIATGPGHISATAWRSSDDDELDLRLDEALVLTVRLAVAGIDDPLVAVARATPEHPAPPERSRWVYRS